MYAVRMTLAASSLGSNRVDIVSKGAEFMKTKNLVIAGVVALALLLGTGAGTASAQVPTPGGDDSTNAANLSIALFQVANNAIQFAGTSGDSVEYAIAFDIFVVSYLCFAIVDGYNSGSFDLSEFLGDAGNFTLDAGVGFELALVADAFSINLEATGSPFGAQIQFLAQQIQASLQSAILNND
jgi:hypothetical protein